MHKTEEGERVKALKKKAQKKAVAIMQTARVTVTNLQNLSR